MAYGKIPSNFRIVRKEMGEPFGGREGRFIALQCARQVISAVKDVTDAVMDGSGGSCIFEVIFERFR